MGPRSAVVASALAVAGLTPLLGCADDPTAASDGTLAVEAAFYPLEWMAARVGGDHVSVTGLTAAGAEPHDLELSPRDVAALADADVVVHLSGFQPAVDDAIESAGADGFDVTSAADLDLTDADGETDLHFWLDPLRLAAVGDAFADELAERDAEHAADYRANAAELRADLEALDAEMAAGMADCAVPVIVTGHTAFAYLADRYGFDQVGVAGSSPSAEPSPSDLADVADVIEASGAGTVYVEPRAEPDLAEAVAGETGAQVVELDPLEALDDDSAGYDYLAVMRSNLEVLRTGQECT